MVWLSVGCDFIDFVSQTNRGSSRSNIQNFFHHPSPAVTQKSLPGKCRTYGLMLYNEPTFFLLRYAETCLKQLTRQVTESCYVSGSSLQDCLKEVVLGVGFPGGPGSYPQVADTKPVGIFSHAPLQLHSYGPVESTHTLHSI